MSTPTLNPARQLLRASKLPIIKLAPMVGVSRQAYHRWLRGLPITDKHRTVLEWLLQEYPEQETITITYEVHSVSFACRCGASLILKRKSGSIARGVFCSDCHEHYWINWDEGILRNGKAE